MFFLPNPNQPIESAFTVKELKMDITELSRGDRISYVARRELNMVPAEPETLIIFIDQDQLTGEN